MPSDLTPNGVDVNPLDLLSGVAVGLWSHLLERKAGSVAITDKVHKFGDHVRYARELKGWSQERLAQEAGVSQTTIDKIERGETKRSRYTVDIAKALGESVANLTRETVTGIYTDEDARIVFTQVPNNEDMIDVWMAVDRSDGRLAFSANSIARIRRSNSIDYAGQTHAFLMMSSSMSPEFEKGDLLYVQGGYPPLLQRATLLVEDEGRLTNGVLGRLVHFDDDYWHIVRWSGSPSQAGAKLETLPRTGYPAHYRVTQRVFLFNPSGG